MQYSYIRNELAHVCYSRCDIKHFMTALITRKCPNPLTPSAFFSHHLHTQPCPPLLAHTRVHTNVCMCGPLIFRAFHITHARLINEPRTEEFILSGTCVLAQQQLQQRQLTFGQEVNLSHTLRIILTYFEHNKLSRVHSWLLELSTRLKGENARKQKKTIKKEGNANSHLVLWIYFTFAIVLRTVNKSLVKSLLGFNLQFPANYRRNVRISTANKITKVACNICLL